MVARARRGHQQRRRRVVLRVRIVGPAQLARLAVVVILLRRVRPVGRIYIRRIARRARRVQKLHQGVHRALVEKLRRVLYRHHRRRVLAYVVLAVCQDVLPGAYVYIRLLVRYRLLRRRRVHVYDALRAGRGRVYRDIQPRVTHGVVLRERTLLRGARENYDEQKAGQQNKRKGHQYVPCLQSARLLSVQLAQTWGNTLCDLLL